MRIASVVLLLHLAAVAVGAEATPTPTDRATATYSFGNVKQWSKVFDDPARDAWQKPAEIAAALALKPGDTVADLGAGTGYLMPYLSKAVGPTGSVLAIEVEATLVTHLRTRAEKEGLDNVVPILGSLANPRLPVGAADAIVILDTFHHFDHRRVYLPRLRQFLAPGGRVAVIDWKEGKLEEGPPPDHKLPRQQVIDEMRAAGFTLANEHEFLPYHYYLVFD